MKKRRELDALVNGKLGKTKTRKTSKKGSGHELLQNESDSSDVEEFSIAAQKTIVRHGPSRLCATCIPVCGFFLLVACIVAVGGLVWVHIKLRNDLDHLRVQLRTVESGNKNTPDVFQEIHSQLKALDDKVKTLDDTSSQHAKQLTSLNQQSGQLRQDTDRIQKKLKDSPALANLPKSVDDLSKNVADFGSEIKSLETNVNSLLKFKTQEEASVAAINKRLAQIEMSHVSSSTVAPSASTPGAVVNQYVQDRLDVLSRDLSLVNASVAAHLIQVSSQIQQQQVKLNDLKNRTEQLQARVALMELSPGATKPNMSDINSIIQDAVSTVAAQLQNASNSHQVAGQDSLAGLANQIQNITDAVTDYRQEFDKFKAAWASGKLDHVNMNMTQGMTEIMQNMLQAYTADTHTQIEILQSNVTDLSGSVHSLQQSVEQQAVTISALSSVLSQQNHTSGFHDQQNLQPTESSKVKIPTTVVKFPSTPASPLAAKTSNPTAGEENEVDEEEEKSSDKEVLPPDEQGENQGGDHAAVPPGEQEKNQEPPEQEEKAQEELQGKKSKSSKHDGSTEPDNTDKGEGNLMHLDTNGDGYVTKEELVARFGAQAPTNDMFDHFDHDRDHKWSYDELKKAFSVNNGKRSSLYEGSRIFLPGDLQENVDIKKKSINEPRNNQGEIRELLGALKTGP